MTRFSPTILKCPCCNQSFETTVIYSFAIFLSRVSTDLYQRTGGLQPLPFLIHSCPHCYYTADMDGFETRKIDQKLRQWILENLKPGVVSEDVPGHIGYECAARIAIYKNASTFEIGNLYLKAAWCCNLGRKREEEQEKFYRGKAIEFYAKAFEGKEVSQPALVKCAYLVAENYRRIGDYQQARLWFDRTIAMAEQDPALAEYLKMAIQQRDNPKEFFEDYTK